MQIYFIHFKLEGEKVLLKYTIKRTETQGFLYEMEGYRV